MRPTDFRQNELGFSLMDVLIGVALSGILMVLFQKTILTSAIFSRQSELERQNFMDSEVARRSIKVLLESMSPDSLNASSCTEGACTDFQFIAKKMSGLDKTVELSNSCVDMPPKIKSEDLALAGKGAPCPAMCPQGKVPRFSMKVDGRVRTFQNSEIVASSLCYKTLPFGNSIALSTYIRDHNERPRRSDFFLFVPDKQFYGANVQKVMD